MATPSLDMPENVSGDLRYQWRHRVPSGWRKAPLGDVMEIVRGISFPKDAKTLEPHAGYVACLRTANVQRDVEWSDLWFVPEEHVKREDQYVHSGDILISTANSYELVGKVARVTNMPHQATLGAFISLLRPGDGLDSKFAYYQIAWSDTQDRIRSTASTTTNISNVSTRKLSNIELAIPPLDQQKRIVAEIEKQFSRLDEAVVNLKRVKANLQRYKAAVLKAAVEGKLTERWHKEHPDVEPASKLLKRILADRRARWTGKGKYNEPAESNITNLPALPKGWVWAKTDQIFWFVTSGSRGWAEYYSEIGSLFLRIGNLDHDSILLDLREIQRVQPPSGTEGIRTRVMPGDILVSITADVGMVALMPSLIEEAYINQHISLARPVSVVNRNYLAWFLCSQDGQKQFKELQRGATKVGLGLDDIKAVNVPLPSLSEQGEIVQEIERRFSVADEIDAVIVADLKRADHLRQAVLKCAFDGRLIFQMPPVKKLRVSIKGTV
jgi:type I restriction enzyme, S subunit